MEQIIITRKDGTTYPLAVKKEATAIREARQSWGLLGDDVVTIAVESIYPQRYEIGDHFGVFGRTYTLNQLPKVRKEGTHKYTYELTFEGVQYDLLRAIYDVSIETTGNTLQDVQGDTLTGDLTRFATVLVANANRVFPGKWRLGACPDTIADKTLTFGDGDNCLAVLQNLCRTFDVEADMSQLDDVCTITFSRRIGETHPFVFEFGKGKGLFALSLENVDSSNIVTRLKVYGSSANITNRYRANRLCLPGKSKAQSYIEKVEAVQKYGIHEARKIFEDIKPTFDGTVTEVVAGNVLQFKDANMFDLNTTEADGKTTKYLVPGVSAKIHFNTGNLAGYEFDIHKYDHATRTFTLKKLTDDRGDVFPSSTSSAFQFSKGDKYKILDVTLPEQYQEEAERKLKEKAEEYYRQNSQPKVRYSLSVSKGYIKTLFGDARGTLISPGDYIKVKDESIGVDKAVRIQSLQRNLLDIYEYTLTLADTAEHSITTRVISELVEIDKITTAHNLKDPARARANWRSSREVLDMVFDPEGDYYSNKIKPNSIDTLALSVGAKSMQFSLQNVVFEANYRGQKNVVRVSSGTLTHYAIDEQPRVWTVANALAELDDDSRAYYIFAKCSKSTNSASIIFTKEPIKTEDVAGFYHFWVGIVNSVDATLRVRSIALSYGFSTINGRFVKTGRVESVDGRTYFDLDRGVIGGRIVFRGSDSEGGEVDAKGYIDRLIAGTNETSLNQARIESTRALREQVSIERDRVYETYRQLRTDKRTPKDKGLALEQAWITVNGAHWELYLACNTAISTPSDDNITTLVTRTREYKTAMVSLQRTIQEVEQAIREDVYNEARGKTRVRVEGKTLDPNKYYPLIIKLLRKTGIDTYGIRLERPLNRDFGVPPYATHAYGYSLLLEWSVMPSGWGSNSDSRKLHAYERRFVADNELVVCPPKQETRANWEYVYVRGGSDYWVEVTGATNLDIQLYPEGVLWEASPGSKFIYRWEVLDSIADLGAPKIDLDTLKDNLLAEVAKARTSLQGAIDAAKTATKAEYEARVQEVLANVSRLESSLGDATSALQRQIDGQVDRLYGSEIARSGVPPTNLWPASDNAKHEGDTYTCVAPKGVTITASNAHEYPNVGRSWRWTNGGSGTTYGWEVIADTDITQALALASKAQATADGKMTHYITPTPPVTYQQGDQWTLPAPWQGRKDGRAYTYPAGSILTATADSISGQHHPEHWVELVRYTDLSIEDIKVGGRNYCRIAGFPMVRHGGTDRTKPFTEVLPAGDYMVSVKLRILNEEATHFAIRPTLDADYKGNQVYRVALNGDGIYKIPVKQTREWDRLYLYSNRGWQAEGTGGRIEFVWIKVEAGSIATDYTLAPEDVAEEAAQALAEAEKRAKEHAERQIAHMDYLKAVLRKGQASIQGGAILGQYIAVADLEQVVRGYISGMLNGVFLAAGVSNHGTPQETRNVEISHDGDGHFGQLHFCGSGQDGRVDLIRPGETDPYLSLGGVLRPIQEVLLDAELRDTYISNQADVDAYPLALSGLTRELKVFSVLRDGASCRVSGQLQAPSMRFNGAGDSQQSQRVTITTEILLQRQQPSSWIDVAVMGDVWVSGSSSQDYWSGESKVIDLRLPNLPKGQYRLLARSRYSDNYYQLQVISQIRIMPLTILVERVSSVQQVAFTEQGFRAFYGPRRYVDIASEGNYVLSARGATDIPGVLAAGRVNARGQVLAFWGARVKDRGTDNVRVSMISDNTYIVYHSIGHLDYVVQLTVQNSWNVASYYDITPWSFRVKMSYPGGSWGNAYAGEFSYVCIGTNG